MTLRYKLPTRQGRIDIFRELTWLERERPLTHEERLTLIHAINWDSYVEALKRNVIAGRKNVISIKRKKAKT